MYRPCNFQVSSRIWGRANDSDGEWEEVNKPSSVIMDQVLVIYHYIESNSTILSVRQVLKKVA